MLTVVIANFFLLLLRLESKKQERLPSMSSFATIASRSVEFLRNLGRGSAFGLDKKKKNIVKLQSKAFHKARKIQVLKARF